MQRFHNSEYVLNDMQQQQQHTHTHARAREMSKLLPVMLKYMECCLA